MDSNKTHEKDVSVLISNTFIIDTKMNFKAINCTMLIQNCTFEGSKLEIDSANNITIMDSHFIVQNVSESSTSNHILEAYNTQFLLISNSYFGNLPTKQNETKHLLTGATSLGIRMENVTLAEVRQCTFAGFKSDESDGTALYLIRTTIQLTSSYFHYNLANHGVIFASNLVNITSMNCSYAFNQAEDGAVFSLRDSCTLVNIDSMFQQNLAIEHGGVVNAKYHVSITNLNCTYFQNEAGERAGAIYIKDDVQVSLETLLL